MSDAGRAVPYIDRGEPLPMSYAEDRIVAMVRDPEHVFAYWDVDTETRVAGRPLVLRAHCLSEGRSFDIETDPGTMSWHLEVKPNRTYRLEIHERRPSGGLRLLAASEDVTTPVRWAGESGGETPAEILHAERRPLSRRKRPTAVGHRVAVGERAAHVTVEGVVHTARVRSGGL